MRTAIGYIRVSSEEQADSGLGLEAQRQRIRAYCEMKGLSLATIFEDPGVSGGKALATRPAGFRLMAEAKKNKPVLVVAKFDRLFRSVADAAQTIADFDKRGIELVAIAEGFDMTNPYGRAMAQMASVFAELERAMIRERTKAAMNVKRGRNERMSHNVPFGWDEVPAAIGRQRPFMPTSGLTLFPKTTFGLVSSSVDFGQELLPIAKPGPRCA